jgi:hypothetical protein
MYWRIFVSVALLSLPLVSHSQPLCGDFDENGEVTATDSLWHLRSTVGLGAALMCPRGGLLGTGQSTPYGAGSDGYVQAGAARSYSDNGDGTITDNNTGLMWEKKDDSGGIHDKDNAYTWSVGTDDLDGTIATVFLATLNAGSGFAGYSDWRIPNLLELGSIIDYEVFDPSVDPAFHRSATCAGCSDVMLANCSCTDPTDTWSSSSVSNFPNNAWHVDFHSGLIIVGVKSSTRRVRAVRGGL